MLNTDTKEIWVFSGVVTDPEAHGKAGVSEGDTEWQFSDGPSGTQGASEDFIDLAEGLKAYSGYVIHWEDTKPKPDPRLPRSIALLAIRNALQEEIDAWNKQGTPFAFAVASAINDAHQANESRIDTDQTQYLLDRKWADDDGWELCPDPSMGEDLWNGMASENDLMKWFG